MNLSELTALSPLDGRYRKKILPVAEFFSEMALHRYRVLVEIEYFISLADLQLPQLKRITPDWYDYLRSIYMRFNEHDANRIKELEKQTNHDVKAVEYFLKEKFAGICEEMNCSADDFGHEMEFFHFGLTSQDINNTSIPLLIKECVGKVMVPKLEELVQELSFLAARGRHLPMLARTHGQPASPTVLGKEIYVFIERLVIQIESLKDLDYPAKFGGATGNFNAHTVAYPEVNWDSFGNRFVEDTLRLSRSRTTTQIEHYDRLATVFDNFSRINTILIDLCRDIWTYISMDYFGLKIQKNEVGSSAMPHKVNPIDFENAEGNLGIANALQHHFSTKLPISRLQRDLTDSTVLRNVGVAFGHSFLSYTAILTGVKKLEIREDVIQAELAAHWEVVAEAIQTILRREGYPKPYETLKELTRTGEKITQESIHSFIQNLEISDSVKAELQAITPWNYVGNAL